MATPDDLTAAGYDDLCRRAHTLLLRLEETWTTYINTGEDLGIEWLSLALRKLTRDIRAHIEGKAR